MAVKPWTQIASTEYDGESPVTEGLLLKFHDNQEALISGPANTRWAEVSGTTGTAKSIDVWIPEAASTDDGDVTLVVRFEAKVDSGSTGKIGLQLGAATLVETTTFTHTAYQTYEVIIPAADVKAAAGTVAALNISNTRTAGAGLIYSLCEFSSSRLERAA